MPLKILILTPRIPYPLRDGGSIAMNQTLEAYLDQGHEVSLLSMNTSRHWVEESTLSPLYERLRHFRTVYVKTNVNPLSAFFNLFTDKSYNVARFINKDFEKELVTLLEQDDFDVIQFESIYTAPYLRVARKHSDARCFCRVHNIEYLIWQRLSEHERSFLKQKYLELLTNRLKNYELDILQKFDLLLPISTKENEYLKELKLNRSYYLPFGVTQKHDLPVVQMEEKSCYHIGSMDWAPNVEGVQWFLENVWTEIHDNLPGVALYLAGKNMPPSFLSKENENLHIVGEVDDVIRFSLEKNIMLVPLLSGAGIRIKILEAMSLGKTIVTTTVGVDGIGAIHMQNILIADTVEDFRTALQFCYNEPEEARKIGERGKEFVFSHYRTETIYNDLIDFIQHLPKDADS